MLKLLSMMALACSISVSAFADEVWVCEFPMDGKKKSSDRFWLTHEQFVEFHSNLPYQIVINNNAAIVAIIAQGQTGSLPLGLHEGDNPIIETDTIAIDRQSGSAVKGGVSIYGGDIPALHGSCRQQTHQDHDAVWPKKFQASSP